MRRPHRAELLWLVVAYLLWYEILGLGISLMIPVINATQAPGWIFSALVAAVVTFACVRWLHAPRSLWLAVVASELTTFLFLGVGPLIALKLGHTDNFLGFLLVTDGNAKLLPMADQVRILLSEDGASAVAAIIGAVVGIRLALLYRAVKPSYAGDYPSQKPIRR